MFARNIMILIISPLDCCEEMRCFAYLTAGCVAKSRDSINDTIVIAGFMMFYALQCTSL